MNRFILVVLSFFLVGSSTMAASKTTITWYGHAAFKITTPGGKHLVIDPWVANPLNPNAKGADDAAKAIAAVDAVGPVDFILVTHGHFDHIADATAIGKKTKARLVANFELGQNMAKLVGFPSDQMGYDTLGNPGGVLPLANGEIKVHFVPAVHSSGLGTSKESDPIHYGGNPVGYVIEIKNGPTIYHSGDTAFFSDMELIGRHFKPDVALINIGGHFGMEPPLAAKAAQVVKAKFVIPHHFKTFPILSQSAKEFFRLLGQYNIAHLEMKPGQTITFDGTRYKK